MLFAGCVSKIIVCSIFFLHPYISKYKAWVEKHHYCSLETNWTQPNLILTVTPITKQCCEKTNVQMNNSFTSTNTKKAELLIRLWLWHHSVMIPQFWYKTEYLFCEVLQRCLYINTLWLPPCLMISNPETLPTRSAKKKAPLILMTRLDVVWVLPSSTFSLDSPLMLYNRASHTRGRSRKRDIYSQTDGINLDFHLP